MIFGILLLAAGLALLLDDPSVKNVKGVKKLEKIASGTRDSFTGRNGAPKPSQDFIGWLLWNGK